MLFADIETFTRTGLEALGYGSLNADLAETSRTMPMILPGPANERTLKKSPSSMLFLQVGNGIGTTVEQAYDRPFIVVRAIGPQNDYEAAEKLAKDVDDLFLSVASPQFVGGNRVLYINRTGGAPQLIDFDASSRYQFQTTYITEAQR